MTEQARKILEIIVDKALETSDMYVLLVEIPVKNNTEAQAIRDELVRYGCISHAEVVGCHYIRCQLEATALEYLK